MSATIRMTLSRIAAAAVVVAIGCAVTIPAEAQQRPAAQGQPGVFLKLPEPYAGLDCGAAYQMNWNLTLDQVANFADTQLSACDLALTFAAIQGDVGRVYDKIAAANTQNWVAFSAAAAFLPKADEPAADIRRTRVHGAQAQIQNARNGLRFLAKLAAVIQYPPAQEPSAVPAPSFGQVSPGPATSEQTPAQTTGIQQTPLAAPDAAASPSAPVAQAPDQSASSQGDASDIARAQIACVTNTAWVVAARPAQNKAGMMIDDPVAGQALVWLAGYRPSGVAQSGFHSFAACAGATPAFAPSSYAPLPGTAQGLTTSSAAPGEAPGQTSQPVNSGPVTAPAANPPTGQSPRYPQSPPTPGQQD
jgi:hypothetical protein